MQQHFIFCDQYVSRGRQPLWIVALVGSPLRRPLLLFVPLPPTPGSLRCGLPASSSAAFIHLALSLWHGDVPCTVAWTGFARDAICLATWVARSSRLLMIRDMVSAISTIHEKQSLVRTCWCYIDHNTACIGGFIQSLSEYQNICTKPVDLLGSCKKK